ncbi:hypothetical protein [uncultured Eubacterium sp.]|uniref:hypothetical protein n=1 Tax=Eubacterium sp. TaxID=142586 RepID=UPI002672035D|nr:hypothetical protein [uncultured Eubacterium sp.]
MKSRLLWTNYKIYAVIFGMLVGTLVYNIVGVDFSFALIDNIHSENFGESYIFFLLQNIKYFIIVMLLSLLRQNKKVLFVILGIQAYIASGAITLCIVLKKTFLITGAVGGIVKGIVADIYLDGQAGIKRILFLLMSIFIGTLIENFFAFYL